MRLLTPNGFPTIRRKLWKSIGISLGIALSATGWLGGGTAPVPRIKVRNSRRN